MEEDFYQISEEEKEELKSLHIPYRWHDKCLDKLKPMMACNLKHRYLFRIICRDLRKDWAKCEEDRERVILKNSEYKLPSLDHRQNPPPPKSVNE